MAPRSKRNGKIDEEIEETFPASDPPAFMGGEVLGSPKGHRTARRRNPAKLRPALKEKAAKRKAKTRRSVKKVAVKKKKRATKEGRPR